MEMWRLCRFIQVNPELSHETIKAEEGERRVESERCNRKGKRRKDSKHEDRLTIISFENGRRRPPRI